jgi:16S rRNA U516 pseudouridylate synthase RsuA-like enzyme
VTSPRASDAAVRALAAGVVITTPAHVAGVVVDVTARTRPCAVTRLLPPPEKNQQPYVSGDDDSNSNTNGDGLQFVLEEGRNRQIRRMCDAVGLSVVALHRTTFAGVTLGAGALIPGSCVALTHAEELLVGARVAPTREELRTPEERAERKAKKLSKKLHRGASENNQ